jgi:hypothetical protein
MDLLDSLGSVYTYDRDLWGAPNGPTGAYPGHSSTYGVEIRKQADGRISLNSTNLKHLDITALSTWLKKPVAPSNSGDLAGVKLLLLEAANAQFGISLGPRQRLAMRNALEEAMRVFEIPSVALAHLVSWVPGFLRLRKGAASTTIAQDDVTTYCLFQLSLGFAWTHSPKQHLTQGIIWYEEAVNPRSRILRDLEDLKAYLEQPMYLALCSCAMAERRIMFERRDLISRVQLVDSKIGTNAGYEFLGKDPWAEQNVKIGELSQLVSEVSSLTVRLRYRMRAVGDLSAELVKENLKSWFRADTATKDAHPELRSQADRIDEMLLRISSFATRILDHAVGLQERISSQMTQVSNLSIMNVLTIGLLKTKKSADPCYIPGGQSHFTAKPKKFTSSGSRGQARQLFHEDHSCSDDGLPPWNIRRGTYTHASSFHSFDIIALCIPPPSSNGDNL